MKNIGNMAGFAGRLTHRSATVAVCSALVALLGAAHVFAAPTAGDSWVYRVVNGYNNEVRGKIQYRVDTVDADRVAMSVSTDVVLLGTSHTEVYTPDGNWLRHPLINHDQPVEYEFAQPYPAYAFPLDIGKAWSLRVIAINTATGKRASVRVDGRVLSTERLTLPAGSFDTIKLRRRIYAGDWDGVRLETNITETEWYAPALGRAVRTDRISDYMDPNRCTNETSACTPVRGDWLLFELVETGAAR